MNYEKFLNTLPQLYDHWLEESVRPKSDRFEKVLHQVKAMTTPNVMQLLNCAVGCMEPDEVYCEIGCYQGSTLIGSLLDNPNRMAYAVDNFSIVDSLKENENKLEENLVKFGIEPQVWFCNQDFRDFFLDLRLLSSDDKIGVYFYDGAHDYRSQILGLLFAKPFLAEQALIIVDDANWDAVKAANYDFVELHPECEILMEILTPEDGHCSFWNGIHVMKWEK